MASKKKEVEIDFIDFWDGFSKENNFLAKILSKKYELIISNNPTYIICSVFGHEHLKHECIKVLFTGENLCPDFNLYDYAMGFNRIIFDDRYIAVPHYARAEENTWELAWKKHTYSDEYYLSKNKFCNYVISNSKSDPARHEIIEELNKYLQVDSGGKYKNNVGGPVVDKLEFAKKYRFSLCFENSSTPGYTTEKIIEAFAAVTIPIYWGDERISEEFNPESFINCHEFSSFSEVVKRVKQIYEDEHLYLQMLKEPAVKGSASLDAFLNAQLIVDFFTNIFEQPVEKAYRRNRFYAGAAYEKRMIFARRMENFLNLFKRPYYVMKKHLARQLRWFRNGFRKVNRKLHPASFK